MMYKSIFQIARNVFDILALSHNYLENYAIPVCLSCSDNSLYTKESKICTFLKGNNISINDIFYIKIKAI